MIRQASLCAAILVSALTGSVGAQQTGPGGISMSPEFNWSQDEPSIRKQIAAGMAGLRPGETPGRSLLVPVVTWLSNTLEFPAIYELPRVEYTPIRLAAMLNDDRLASQPGVSSRYDDAKQTIYLSDNWNGGAPESASLLIREMVHHLQNIAKIPYQCPQWRDKLAYVAQERWLVAYGRSLEKDFGVDPLTYLLSTECYIP